MIVLAVFTFLFENIRKKRSVTLTKQVVHVLKILVPHLLTITCLDYQINCHRITVFVL